MAIGWDVIIAKPRMPILGGTVNSEPITIPQGSLSVTIHIPTLAGAATVLLQVLDPITPDPVTGTWRPLTVFNLSAGGVQALAAMAGNQAITLPVAALGGGVFRLVASSDQSGSPLNVACAFARVK